MKVKSRVEQIGEHTVDENQVSHCRRKKKRKWNRLDRIKLWGWTGTRIISMDSCSHLCVCVCVCLCVYPEVNTDVCTYDLVYIRIFPSSIQQEGLEAVTG